MEKKDGLNFMLVEAYRTGIKEGEQNMIRAGEEFLKVTHDLSAQSLVDLMKEIHND